MNKNNRCKAPAAILTAILALTAQTVVGQTNDSASAPFKSATSDSPPGESAQDYPQLMLYGDNSWQAVVTSSYTASGSAKFEGAKLGDSDAVNVDVGVSKRFALDDNWFLRFDLAEDNLFLGTVPGAPVPDAIHTMRVGLGLGRRLNDQWTLSAMVSPMLYRFDDIQSSDIGIAGGLLATYRVNPDLMWVFGLLVAPDSDVPVLPTAGVDWKINDEFRLQLMFPKPRLIYKIDSNWRLYTGLDMVGAIFRTSDDSGAKTGLPQYNDALGEYRDLRLGVGVSRRLIRGLNLSAEAGYSVYREIDYVRIDQDVRFDPAPYVRLTLNYRF